MNEPEPQGGVISPLLSNLYLHYAFDVWMTKHHPESLWCRYADDGIGHCKTEEQAEALRVELEQRFKECKLEIHPEKTEPNPHNVEYEKVWETGKSENICCKAYERICE